MATRLFERIGQGVDTTINNTVNEFEEAGDKFINDVDDIQGKLGDTLAAGGRSYDRRLESIHRGAQEFVRPLKPATDEAVRMFDAAVDWTNAYIHSVGKAQEEAKMTASGVTPIPQDVQDQVMQEEAASKWLDDQKLPASEMFGSEPVYPDDEIERSNRAMMTQYINASKAVNGYWPIKSELRDVFEIKARKDPIYGAFLPYIDNYIYPED